VGMQSPHAVQAGAKLCPHAVQARAKLCHHAVQARAQLCPHAVQARAKLYPHAVQARAKLWRTWGAALSMLPVGGPAIWGNVSWAPDDDDKVVAERRTLGTMVASVATNQPQLISNSEVNSSNTTKEEWQGLTATLRSYWDKPTSSESTGPEVLD
jgi:hypothetical protein